jgi:alpha-L-fucosidase
MKLNLFVARTCIVFFLGAALTHAAETAADSDRASTAREYTPSSANKAAREAFQDAKFGIFIHWGLYSLMAGGGEPGGNAEWIMERKRIPIAQYERLAELFNPSKFDADQWVRTFKDAGASYVTITSKHHDGFALYDSKISNYDVVESTPFRRDIIKELKDACERHGLKLFLYYSQLDWHHPDYYPTGRTGHGYTGRKQGGQWDKYIDYQNAQLTELLTGYGEIGGIWFDGWWDRERDEYRDRWRLSETYELIHRLQPHALIGNNHHQTPFPGEDFQMFEQDLPGENEAGFNTASVSALPLEMADTMNGTWGYSLTDPAFKTTKEIVQRLVGAAGRNANYLLNTGPMPDGRLQPENVNTLREIGEWMRVHGESIVGTRGGPVSPRPWGVTTQTDDAVYVHVLDWQDRTLFVPLTRRVAGATLLASGAKISFRARPDGIELDLPLPSPENADTVVKLHLSR